MGESMHEEQSAGGNFDLSQFYDIFFEEAGENLDQMEQMLLQLDLETADDEELNAIFRCAHSIKGGAATFGFADVAELTHQMESLLDKLRRHELQPTAPMVDVLLESSDALRLLLARHQGRSVDTPATASLVARISELAQNTPPVVAAAASPTAAPEPVAVSTPDEPPAVAPAEPAPAAAPAALAPTVSTAAPSGERALDVQIGPLTHLEQADGIADLFRDIAGLGRIESVPCEQADRRAFRVHTNSSDADLLDLFMFHVSREQIHITPVQQAAPQAVEPTPAPAATPVAPATATPAKGEGADFGFFDDAPGAPASQAVAATPAPAPVAAPAATPVAAAPNVQPA
ncbi:MAG TPA: Hpt domain-containing protein, partial [Hydrogenophaga sp.]